MVKEEIDRLLEAGFIYLVNNSEWVSPIVVVPKKVGADGKVKIRVCQDFRKLNSVRIMQRARNIPAVDDGHFQRFFETFLGSIHR
jgi:hypothetical protein